MSDDCLSDVSVVVPVHNDRSNLARLLGDLRPYSDLDVVVVDAASNDCPEELLDTEKFVQSSSLGRGSQLRCGIDLCERKWVWMLHADSRVNERVIQALEGALADADWGRFDVRLAGDRTMYRVIEFLMNERSAITGICTGDQGIFVRKDLLMRIDGVPRQSLMEDIELCKRLRRVSPKPHRIREPLVTSTRKWETEGVLSTIVRMWMFRLRYFLGVDAEKLYEDYYGTR